MKTNPASTKTMPALSQIKPIRPPPGSLAAQREERLNGIEEVVSSNLIGSTSLPDESGYDCVRTNDRLRPGMLA